VYNQVGGYSYMGAHVVTVLEAVQKRFPTLTVTYARGCNIDDSDTSQINDAIQVANKSDLVILVLGDSNISCGELADRSNLDVPGAQLQLLDAMFQTAKPLVVVLINGRPMTFGSGPNTMWGSDNPLWGKLIATFVGWRPGEEGGNAILDLMLGNVNPSGRLAQNWPREPGQVHSPSSPWFQLYQGENQNGTYADNWPALPLWYFGYGLSYGHFKFTVFTPATQTVSATDNITVNVTVTSTATLDSLYIIQIYYNQVISKYVRYQLMLAGFKKVFIPKGGAVTTTITFPARNLGYYDPDLKMRVVESGDYTLYLGADSRTKSLTLTSVVHVA